MGLVVPHDGGRDVGAVLRQIVIDVGELAVVPLRGIRGMRFSQLRQVGQRLGEFGLISCLSNRWKQDGDQQGNDGNHNQQFNNGETTLVGHAILLLVDTVTVGMTRVFANP